MINSKFRLFLGIVSILMPLLLMANGINIQHAYSKKVNDIYLVDAKIEFDFDDEVLNALEHGVSINIDVIVKIKRERAWLWDPTIIENDLKFKLEHLPLSNLFIVTNLINGSRHQFQSLEDAIKDLGTITNQVPIEQSILDKNETYIGFIRAKLDIESLPLPLQPVAHVSRDWQLESQWYEWVVR